MNMRLWGAGAAAVLALAAGAAWLGLRPSAARAGPTADKTVALEFTPGEVAQPQRVRLKAQVEFSGPLVAPQTAVVRAKAAGTLLTLDAAEGARVRAGQALGRVDLAELASRVAERQANVESARATLAQAERTHASNERLAAQHFISPMALDNSRAALDTARAALAAAQATLETTRVSLRDASLVAPIGGVVSKRYAVPGEKLAAEQQVLAIVDVATLELAGSVGTHEVSRLAPGMAAQVAVEGADAPVEGRIARIAPAAEPGTRSIGVTIVLPNPKETWRAGQYAVARVELPDSTERLVVPAGSVGSTGGQDHVWVIADGVLARRAVTLGRRDERAGRVEVLSGLDSSSVVLASRFDNLREGRAAVVAARPMPPVVATAASAAPLR